MEQTNSLAMNMLQTMAGQAAGIPKTGKTEGGDELSDFQKLLDEKAQEKDPLLEEPPRTQTKTEAAPAKKTEKAPVQKEENSLERVKKLAEQGYAVVQPTVAVVAEDGQVYQPDQCVWAWKGSQMELIPVTDLDEAQLQQLEQLTGGVGLVQTIDVSDPEADAILEATAPGADNSPAAMLEKMVAEETGQTAEQAVEEVQPKNEDDGLMESLGSEQVPQRIFHDVEAAPVKVGETENPQQADGPDVIRQIDSQLIQAMQRGESAVSVRLNPENLGEVTVEVRQDAAGALHITLSAHSSETRSLLERHAGELQGLVSSRTQQSVEVDVQRGQENQQSQNQQRSYDGHNGHAQDGQQERRQRREHTASQDFIQQLRLGLIPTDGEA